MLHTHTHTHTLIHITHTYITHTQTLTHTIIHTHTHINIHTHTHTLTQVHCQGLGCTSRCPSGAPLASLGLRRSAGFAWQRGRRGAMCTAKGSAVCPGVPLASLSGVPWSPPLCRWLLRGRRGTMCTAKGSAVRPGVPLASLWRPLVSAALPVLRGSVAGVGQCALPRAWLYAPVFLITHTHSHIHAHHSHIHHTHTLTHIQSLTHTHLLRTIFANSDVECIVRAKRSPIKPDRREMLTRSEKDRIGIPV